jgi:hypothetical protein
MSPASTTSTLIQALLERGHPGRRDNWHDRDPDYVAEYGLTADHVPALIELATRWDDAWNDSEAVYAPVHAWRALAQLRAVDAVQPLLEAQRMLDEMEDDWYLDDFHLVFGLIGPPALDKLAAFLADPSECELPRTKAADGLSEIAQRHPDTRGRVIQVLTSVLGQHRVEDAELNGSIVGDLVELEAVEAAAAIERAFAANVIDPTIAGDWSDVRRELGVTGIGLAPDTSPGWTTLAERLGFPSVPYETVKPHRVAQQRRADRAHERKAKAKRKQQRKDRKRNRKAR